MKDNLSRLQVSMADMNIIESKGTLVRFCEGSPVNLKIKSMHK
jgi:hypothetical protein